ncbi:MAG: CCA tRNA nucleotidyltransferase [Chlamydiae bacterium]|nr:CCA tRNA nucleotidyltransferase [Chlamydiota bacterium]
MEEAIFIVKQLQKKGHKAYFAGGWVRDFLLNHPSDDIDIATDASPEVIQALFPHTVPIGIAFGIVLVIINNKQYEVATFREDIAYIDGRRPSSIKFSSPDEDAKRRDFTINGMFYDPVQKQIFDFVNGQEDLQKKIIRAIGNPHERFKEDRLRMIRAVRLSARFNFAIEEDTQKAIMKHAKELFPSVAIERVTQEFNKMASYKGFKNALLKLFEFGLLQTIFPKIKDLAYEEIDERLKALDDFPTKAPIVVPLLELFPESSLQERLDLCKYLKLSNQEMKFVEFLYNAELMAKDKTTTDDKWAYFYSNPFADLAIQILAIHCPYSERVDFLKEHDARKEELQNFIGRIKRKDPVVKSDHLKLCDILPGKDMGLLLSEAEKISINERLESSFEIIQKLKQSKTWPKVVAKE